LELQINYRLMNFKKGISRIYIVLSFIWFSFFMYGYTQGYGNENMFIALIPVPIYFVLKWISKGFE
jgi:hypothetical protein